MTGQSDPGRGHHFAGAEPDGLLTKRTVVWTYRPACIFGQQVLWLPVLTILLLLISTASHSTPKQVLCEVFALQGLAFGVPLGMLAGLLYGYQETKFARSL